MTDIWTEHARTSGRRAVINPSISEEEFDRVTLRQMAELQPMILAEMTGSEERALDYGCGPGRFLPMLLGLVPDVAGYDPCREYIGLSPPLHRRCLFTADAASLKSHSAQNPFDLVFCWLVLGGITDPEAPEIADEIVSCLSPGGLLVFGDHCEWWKQERRWWRFRSEEWYQAVFGARGVKLEKIGEIDQVGNLVTVFAGRKAS